MIVDEVKITVTAGHGGRGAVAFSRMGLSRGKTAGGNGGAGGDIYVQGVADLSALRQFRFKKDYKAKDGENGKSALNDGRKSDDLILFVPVGTVCHNITLGKELEITKIGQTEMVAHGGKGGKGNWFFRSATNTSPREFQPGRPGEYFELKLELKLIADVGFVGMPNVGKSSLLNELTNASSKVANYQFTTLEPNLGVYYGLVLADIPGLIEGASTGKGLGMKFLRHVERTKVLFHLVAADSPAPVADYKAVRKELEEYGRIILDKPEYIFLSKSDTVDAKTILAIKKEFKKIKKEIIPISVIDPESIKAVKKILNEIISEKTETEQ